MNTIKGGYESRKMHLHKSATVTKRLFRHDPYFLARAKGGKLQTWEINDAYRHAIEVTGSYEQADLVFDYLTSFPKN